MEQGVSGKNISTINAVTNMQRKMKDSGIPWIGMIPEEWEVHCLRGISKGFKKGNGITKEDLVPDGDILCVRYGDLYTKYNHHIFDIRCRTNKSKIESPVYAQFGDILFTCSGEDISLIGKSCAFMSEGDCLIGGDLIIMKHHQNPKFLGYSLDSEMAQQQKSCGRSKLKVVHISVKDLKKVVIPIPPLAEQEVIASWLDEKCGEIDELIDVEQKMIDELEAYRQATITETVTRGLNPDVPTKQSGYEWIGNIPEHWDIKRLRFLGTTQNGISKDGSYFGEGFPFVNYGDAYNNIFLPENPVNLAKSTPIDQEIYSIKYGDVLFTRTSETIEEIGFSSACRKTIPQSVFSGFLIRFRPTTGELKPQYAGYYFRSNIHRLFFVKEMNIVTRASLGQNLLRNLPVLLPPVSEQIEIGNFLDTKCAEIDDLIKVKREKIETLKQYRQSIIFEAVTGKICIE